MSRKFVSLIIAASIAVTGMTAAPAQAGERDLARALAAIAGVAIVGAVVHNARKDKSYVAPRQYRPQYRPQFRQQHRPRYRSHYQPQRQHVYQPRHRAAERAYRQGFRDHRRVVRERRAERHHGQRGKQRYSARPHRRGH